MMTDVIERSGPLTAAQEAKWPALCWRGSGGTDRSWAQVWDIPAGISVDAAVAALTRLTVIHEILRTVFVPGPDGIPRQLVLAADGLRLPIHIAAVEDFDRFFSLQGIDLAGGPWQSRPLWDAWVYTCGDDAKALALRFEHIVTDGQGLRNWYRQFIDLCLGRPIRAPRFQPLDRRAEEIRRTAHSDDRSQMAEMLEGSPQLPIPPHRIVGDDIRTRVVQLRYERMLPLIDRIADRERVTRSAVLLFATWWVVSRCANRPDVYFTNLVADRLPDDQGIDCRVRDVDFVVECPADLSLGDSVRRTCRHMLEAYAHAVRFGPLPTEVRARTLAARGIGACRPVVYDFRDDGSADTHAVAAPDHIVVRREDYLNASGVPYRRSISFAAEDGDVAVELTIDPAVFPERFVDLFEDAVPRLLRRLHDTPDATIGKVDAVMAGRPVTHECLLVGGRWFAPLALVTILRSHPAVSWATATVEAEDVTAEVTVAPNTEPFELHEHVLGSLYRNLDVVAPSRYRVRGALDRPFEWRPGQHTPVLSPSTRAENDLCEAIRMTQGIEVRDVAQTYAQAGGRWILAPLLVESLRTQGWEGLLSHHFTTPFTLRAMARALTATSREDTWNDVDVR